jgi:hypothetical protein
MTAKVLICVNAYLSVSWLGCVRVCFGLEVLPLAGPRHRSIFVPQPKTRQRAATNSASTGLSLYSKARSLSTLTHLCSPKSIHPFSKYEGRCRCSPCFCCYHGGICTRCVWSSLLVYVVVDAVSVIFVSIVVSIPCLFFADWWTTCRSIIVGEKWSICCHAAQPVLSNVLLPTTHTMRLLIFFLILSLKKNT